MAEAGFRPLRSVGRSKRVLESSSSHFLRLVTGRLTLLSFLQPPLPASLPTLWRGSQTLLEIPALSREGAARSSWVWGQSWLHSSLPLTISWVVRLSSLPPTPPPHCLAPTLRGGFQIPLGFGTRRQLEEGDLWTAGLGGEKTGRVRSSTSPDHRGGEGAGWGRVAMAPW